MLGKGWSKKERAEMIKQMGKFVDVGIEMKGELIEIKKGVIGMEKGIGELVDIFEEEEC